jgi:23S rRNA (cytidine1920-2'-O)/16S rRNA (cytidine1409-2'-O)-methyltransferase
VRADQLLVQRGLAPTRSAAQRLIEHGAVRWLGLKGWAIPKKAGEDLPEGCELEVTDNAELRWASRAGLKLEGALNYLGLDITGWRCLDLGQSTGGFTDVLLARGASTVAGVDVGHGQIHPRLAADPRVDVIEDLDARDWANSQINPSYIDERFDFVVGDVSFISQTLVLSTVQDALDVTGHVLMLVKPQFELQPADIGKGGIVKDPTLYAEVERRIRSAYEHRMLDVKHYFESPIAGGDGNREFFVHATRGYETLLERVK